MTRQTTFSFTLDPTPEQRAALSRHVGASRFAFNQCLRLVLTALEAKKEQLEARAPWSGFDLINAFNAWKRSPDAGVDAEGAARGAQGQATEHAPLQEEADGASVISSAQQGVRNEVRHSPRRAGRALGSIAGAGAAR